MRNKPPFNPRRQLTRTCHDCHGTGTVSSDKRFSDCYYCRGKGVRTSHYGRDEE